MDIEKLLADYEAGSIKKDELIKKLKTLPFEDIGFAKIDHHRALRRGFPEVVYCEGKTIAQIAEIFKALDRTSHNILLTRVTDSTIFEEIKKINSSAEYSKDAKVIYVKKQDMHDVENDMHDMKNDMHDVKNDMHDVKNDMHHVENDMHDVKKGSIIKKPKKILILTAGTSDIPVAEEAAITAEIMGCSVEKIYDVGVAGIHRLFAFKEKIADAAVIIVAAGMEGALPSVVSGICPSPVIAVPTSIGYGANFSGIAPLLAMMNSCSPGVVVVNINNGFGAGYFAAMITRLNKK